MSDETETVVPKAINVLLTVEQRQDGRYYVVFNNHDFELATPIQWEPEYRFEWGTEPLLHFRFSGMHLGGRP